MYLKQPELDFSDTTKVIDLNKHTLNCAGIWPESIHEPIFIFFSTYLAIHCTLAIFDITDHILDMEYVISSITENMFNLMTLLKICICRLKRNSLAEFLKDIKIDVTPERYKTPEEKTAFLAYNNFSLKLVKISMILGIIAATMYYVIVLIPNVKMGSGLGPLLYAISSTDLPTCDVITTATIADDTALLASDNNPQNSTDILQRTLDTLERWS
ncbi:uncharacterized protein LOC122521758 [Polistes fuscatus]|uniref:uncharacterized protein LOC122521758 n=1 Tax=Polistes fuscatus TaxID=30207 RepID=UPI001CA84B36|nr:uncharacterized protein LOC122521758 [Polistes fuscatus]